jgi:hypothetical protein
VFVFVFSRRRGGGEEEEEGEEAPTSTFQTCWEAYGYGVCVCAFFPLPFFPFLYFFPPKNTKPFQQQHPSTAFKKRKKSA